METNSTIPVERKYIHLIGFAKVDKLSNGKPTVLLLDKDGVSMHKDPTIPLIFSHDFKPNQVFKTTLNDINETPVDLINILAEFTEEIFDQYKQNIPSLGDWADAEASDGRPSMNPTDPPGGTLGGTSVSTTTKAAEAIE